MRCQICAVSIYATRTRLSSDPPPTDPDRLIFTREMYASRKERTSCSVLADESGCQDQDIQHPNGDEIIKTHVSGPGCNYDRAYSGRRISHQEMEGSQDATYIVEQPTPDYAQTSYEQKSGFCIPSNPACVSEEFGFYALERGPMEDLGNEAYHFVPLNQYNKQEDYLDDLGHDHSLLGFPVHTWCWKNFERACIGKFGEVDLQGIAALFFRESCFRCGFTNMTHHPAVARNQNPTDNSLWTHALGTEFLTANPEDIPGYLFSIQQGYSVTLEAEQIDRSNSIQSDKPDIFAILPFELRVQIAKDLTINEILNLRSISRAFQSPNPDLYLHFIKRDFPWFHEFDQVKDLNDLYHSKLQAKKDVTIASIEVEIQNNLGTQFEVSWRKYLTKDLLAPPPLRKPDWEQLYKNLYAARRQFMGVRNRERIWVLVEEIVRRIEALRGRLQEVLDVQSGIMLLPARFTSAEKAAGTDNPEECMRCKKIE